LERLGSSTFYLRRHKKKKKKGNVFNRFSHSEHIVKRNLHVSAANSISALPYRRQLLILATGRTLGLGVRRQGLAFFPSRLGSLGKPRKLPGRVLAGSRPSSEFSEFCSYRMASGKSRASQREL